MSEGNEHLGDSSSLLLDDFSKTYLSHGGGRMKCGHLGLLPLLRVKDSLRFSAAGNDSHLR